MFTGLYLKQQSIHDFWQPLELIQPRKHLMKTLLKMTAIRFGRYTSRLPLPQSGMANEIASPIFTLHPLLAGTSDN